MLFFDVQLPNRTIANTNIISSFILQVLCCQVKKKANPIQKIIGVITLIDLVKKAKGG